MKRTCATLLICLFTLQLLGTQAADVAEVGTNLQAVEDDVHEFMEYAFEPFFQQLKSSLAEPPAHKKAWVPVKANSLMLAENGNLLMLRAPDENEDDWNRLSADLREQGKLLYQAAKKRDYEITKKHYVSFVSKCNACHEKFADGEHLQKP